MGPPSLTPSPLACLCIRPRGRREEGGGRREEGEGRREEGGGRREEGGERVEGRGREEGVEVLGYKENAQHV